ncbi:glutamyl-Q tRNA(Asp) ligase [Pandoraea thiooxydans]|uniref:tRNA glutamyl-Q(34) synthetase GluQRS n=1 Tax=Pandoraea thiooxydans TaxID=445709 RepID=UPI00094A1A24|nr:tRNA glutamyl-Q(34) synthetase GluQRS [Pandoraea thiooxydans]APR93947.1 glutamyl-Q tRNA(Asp) ligase [Pandoraea thiooxydans]
MASARPLTSRYRGRFAPSPTGPLHRGSLVTALASYLDARAHGGKWLIRIEDLDEPRCLPGMAEDILDTLAAVGMRPDEPVSWQHRRVAHYQAAFDALDAQGLIYPCGCTRREIADSLANTRARHTTLAYPGTCRNGLQGKAPRAWRLRVPDGDAAIISFTDRWLGQQRQNLATEVGDFVLKRADGPWAYQLAVVVDDAEAGITDVVRGADLLDSTARQIYLQQCLKMPVPGYMHVPLVLAQDGEKLSKQNGAQPLDRSALLSELAWAARFLGLPMTSDSAATLERFYECAIAAWGQRWVTCSPA